MPGVRQAQPDTLLGLHDPGDPWFQWGCPIQDCGRRVVGPWELEWHTAAEHPGWTATYELLRPYPNQRMGSYSGGSRTRQVVGQFDGGGGETVERLRRGSSIGCRRRSIRCRKSPSRSKPLYGRVESVPRTCASSRRHRDLVGAASERSSASLITSSATYTICSPTSPCDRSVAVPIVSVPIIAIPFY